MTSRAISRSRRASAAMTSRSSCGYRDSLGGCREGWIREPDGYGCVQWALCPECGYGEDSGGDDAE